MDAIILGFGARVTQVGYGITVHHVTLNYHTKMYHCQERIQSVAQ